MIIVIGMSFPPTNKTMNLSIGILAHNESTSIGKTLQSLLRQSLFDLFDTYNRIEIIVVPNGCTDNTAEVARSELRKLMGQSFHPHLQWRVCEVTQPGKSNAWNLYVHEFSDPAADFLILMDADIELRENHTLRNMIDTLKSQKEVWIALDNPIKDVALKKNKNILEKLSVSVSGASNAGDLYICGQLYCGLASVLRTIWMPVGLPVEDGFLTGMIIRDRFTSAPNPERIVRVRSASHIFKAYIHPRELLRHEQRIVIGIVINIFLNNYLQSKCNQKQDAGSLIKNLNHKDPAWLKHFIEESVSLKGWWIIPLSLVFRRFRSLQHHSFPQAIFLTPIVVVAFLVDLLVFIPANRKLSQGVGMNYW